MRKVELTARRAAHKRGNILSQRAYMGGRLVRIRIYGIIGFSGFAERAFNRKALVHIRFGWIWGYGEKRRMG